jgi:exopolyphosphatase/guanosine-5'-triphosphate,3'-diphosphate pyrophosphatase
LRLAVALDRRKIGAIERVQCDYLPDDKVLHLRLVPTHPGDDCALELWSLDYKKGICEEEFNLEVVTSLESASVAVG